MSYLRPHRAVFKNATLAALLAGCSSLNTPSTPVAPPFAGRLAFMTSCSGLEDIYSINVDGSGRTRLTTAEGADTHAAWSPNGRKIAFMSQRDGNAEIYTMNADGSQQTRLTHTAATDDYPSWSPDGRTIAFESARGSTVFSSTTQIYTMNADGSQQTRLTADEPFFSLQPSWSPDGRRIAFVGIPNDIPFAEIYVMDADGSNVVRLTHNEEDDRFPSWSPDGRRITFTALRQDPFSRLNKQHIYAIDADGSRQALLIDKALDSRLAWSPDGRQVVLAGDTGIYTLRLDGSAPERLTNMPTYDSNPAWSPDGRRIVFTSQCSAGEIFVMGADGTGRTRLTNNSNATYTLATSPDGRHIAFIAPHDAVFEVHLLKADGSGLTKLTDSDEYISDLAWSPDGQRIAFVSHYDNGGRHKIFVVDIAHMSLIDTGAAGYAPAWSPDSQRIAFVTDSVPLRSYTQIAVMNADGSQQTRLTDKRPFWRCPKYGTQQCVGNARPTWSPDGQRIAFVTWDEREENTDIVVMRSDGSRQRRLTNNDTSDDYPAWSPDGQRIAFLSKRDGIAEIYTMNADGWAQTRLTDSRVNGERYGVSGDGLQIALDNGAPLWSLSGQQIFFPAHRDGNWEIYRMNADGSAVTRLTTTQSDEYLLVWVR